MLTGMGVSRLEATRRAFGSVFRNRDLRRVQLAYFAFGLSEWGTWVAILVFAYGRGGAAETGLVAVIQLVPAAIVAPLAAVLGDRVRRDRALMVGHAVQATVMVATAAALSADAPIGVIYALAAATAASITLTRPVLSALIPQLAETPEEVTAANVVAGGSQSAVVMLGPAAAGLLLAIGDTGLVFAVFAGVLVLAALLAFGLQPRPAPDQPPEHLLRQAAEGFRALAREPSQRLIVGLLAGQDVIAGMFDVLLVVIALGLLGLPESGAGFLAAALGAGGIIGGVWAIGLVGRRHLSAAMAASLLVYGLGTAALALSGVPLLTAAFLVVAGSGYTRANTAGRILLQRVVPDRLLARVFGVLEGVRMVAMAVGAGLAPVLVAALGLRGGIVAAGLLLPAAVLLMWARIRSVDLGARVPEEEIALLRTIDLFAPLPAATLEGVASRLIPVSAPPQRVVIREGDPGDRFYVVAEGQVEVTRQGRPVTRLGPGSYFGEIALLRDVPRTATVTAAAPTELLALERADFLEAITGHPVSHEAAAAAAQARSPHPEEQPG